MSNSGTGYLLESFRFNNASVSDYQNIMGGVATGPEDYLRGRGLYDGFRHGAINPSALGPIMG
jgi:hypothetical protein